MDEYGIDVVMITYNHESFIESAVGSVLEQRVDVPLRILIGDDASTDSTPRLLRDLASHEPRIELTLRERNVGMHGNLSGIWSKVTARYIALLEGDDRWLSSQKLQRQLEAMEAHSEWGLCFHPVRTVSAQGDVVVPKWPDPALVELNESNLLYTNFIPTPSVLYRRIAGMPYPSWLFDLAMADWPLHLLHSARRRIGFIDETWAEYRLHPGGLWSQRSRPEQQAGIIRAVTSFAEHASEFGLPRSTFDRVRVQLLQEYAAESADSGQRGHAVSMVASAFVIRPLDLSLVRSRLSAAQKVFRRLLIPAQLRRRILVWLRAATKARR